MVLITPLPMNLAGRSLSIWQLRRDAVSAVEGADFGFPAGISGPRCRCPPRALDQSHQPIVSRLGRHVAPQQSRRRALPRAEVREVPPRDCLDSRMGEERRIELARA